MADKAINELVAATSVGASDLFVLEQSNTAKKLTGQILENWLVSFADGHGGIQTIAKTSSTGTNPVVDTYTITFADTSTSTFTVTNGLKGDQGNQTYVWIKYASVQPTSNAQMGDLPDNWMGIYVGLASTAPANYTSYSWFEIKGDKGDTGDGITAVELTAGNHDPGTTDTYTVYAEGNAVGAFTVWNGINGSGSVSSVNSVFPDGNGNVTLTAADIDIGASSVVPGTDVVNGAVGTSDAYARGDHRHPLNVPISGTPAALGTPSQGSSTNYSRSDHVHPMPTPANVGAMYEWDLLWENASPDSSFAAQTVSVDLSGYDAVMVIFNCDTSSGSAIYQAYMSNITQVGKRGVSLHILTIVGGGWPGGAYDSYRTYDVTASGIAFDDCYERGAKHNATQIPGYIYGIKGVHSS